MHRWNEEINDKIHENISIINNEILELDFTEKQIKGLTSLKAFLKFSIFSLKFL